MVGSATVPLPSHAEVEVTGGCSWSFDCKSPQGPHPMRLLVQRLLQLLLQYFAVRATHIFSQIWVWA
jgi:hypothetical protein